MKLHKKFNSLFISLLVFSANAQEVNIIVAKNKFRLNDEISISFNVNSSIDSIAPFNPENFKIISEAKKYSSSSYSNNEFVKIYNVLYVLKAESEGIFTITSPIIFSKGKELEKKEIKIEITEKISDINEEDFKKFKNQIFKPEGTTRYTINGDFGYIEIYKNSKWEFYKQLSKDEISEIQKVN